MGFDYRKNLLRAACMENGDGFAIMPTGKVLNHPVAFGGSRGISGIREKVAQGTISCRTGTSRRLDNARSVLHHSLSFYQTVHCTIVLLVHFRFPASTTIH
jgi:hypothetical protein